MKKILFILLLVLPMALSAQSFVWTFSCKIPVTHTDTILWADNFRDKPFSLEVDYLGLNHAVQFAIVISNSKNGAYSFFAIPSIIFPVTLDPAADAYTDPLGVSHASWAFEGKDIKYVRFGVLIRKIQATTGNVNGRLKQ